MSKKKKTGRHKKHRQTARKRVTPKQIAQQSLIHNQHPADTYIQENSTQEKNTQDGRSAEQIPKTLNDVFDSPGKFFFRPIPETAVRLVRWGLGKLPGERRRIRYPDVSKKRNAITLLCVFAGLLAACILVLGPSGSIVQLLNAPFFAFASSSLQQHYVFFLTVSITLAVFVNQLLKVMLLGNREYPFFTVNGILYWLVCSLTGCICGFAGEWLTALCCPWLETNGLWHFLLTVLVGVPVCYFFFELFHELLPIYISIPLVRLLIPYLSIWRDNVLIITLLVIGSNILLRVLFWLLKQLRVTDLLYRIFTFTTSPFFVTIGWPLALLILFFLVLWIFGKEKAAGILHILKMFIGVS